MFTDHWVILHGITDFVVMDNGTHSIRNFFDCLCTFLGTKQLTTSSYHPQTYGQVEMFRKTIIARLRPYVEERLQDWYTYLLPSTNAYNMQLHHFTNLSPFILILSMQPQRPTVFCFDTTATTSPHVMRVRLLQRLWTLQQDAGERMETSHHIKVDNHERRICNASKKI